MGAVILVIGGTGATGRATVRNLVGRGAPVRVVTRDPERAATIPELTGAELQRGDSSRPETLETALDGVSKLYLVPPTLAGWDVAESGIVALAAATGVEHVVRISALGTQPDADSMSLSFHWRGERALERSGIAYTHVRTNSFFQNTLYDAPSIRADDAIYSCVGSLRFAKLDTRDIGEVVATVLTSAGHEGRAYTLTGPEALSYHDLAEVMSGVLDRRIRYVDLTVDQYADALTREGFPAWLADEFAAIYGKGFGDGTIVEEVTDTVEALLGRPPRTFEQFVRDYRSTFD